MKIRQLSNITQDIVAAFERLLPQLTHARAVPAMAELEAIINSDNVFLFVAEEDEQIFGTVTLATYQTLSGMKAWIEDVIVDESQHGRGIGRMLVQFVLDFAQGMGIQKIDLTSNPNRLAANTLYQKMGLSKRETNVYRFEAS
ncbi:hypothetical protein AGMMS49982_24240 [Bacteroidia bacterium]|nr:hypothetical protein AGMMS49982_24240 [Bacteroidia bacterium]